MPRNLKSRRTSLLYLPWEVSIICNDATVTLQLCQLMRNLFIVPAQGSLSWVTLASPRYLSGLPLFTSMAKKGAKKAAAEAPKAMKAMKAKKWSVCHRSSICYVASLVTRIVSILDHLYLSTRLCSLNTCTWMPGVVMAWIEAKSTDVISLRARTTC